MTAFALETASELILFGLVPLFLTLDLDTLALPRKDYPGRLRATQATIASAAVTQARAKAKKSYSVDLRFALRVARLVQV